eukprot:gene35820-43447_t
MDTYNSEEESGSEEESDYSVPLSVLTPDEAVQLLVVLGCVPELKDRIEALELTGVVDGEFLEAIDGFDTLQELEQDTSAVRRAKLKVVLKRLQILQMEGIPRPMLEDIRAMIAEAEAESRAALKRKTFEGTASLKHAIGQWNVGSRMPPVDYLFFESHSVAQARRK